MNKSDLVDEISTKAGITKRQAAKALDAILDSLSNSLTHGEIIKLRGFGTFSVSKRAARIGRNPRTGEHLKVSASKKPSFKASASLVKMMSGQTGGGGPGKKRGD